MVKYPLISLYDISSVSIIFMYLNMILNILRFWCHWKCWVFNFNSRWELIVYRNKVSFLTLFILIEFWTQPLLLRFPKQMIMLILRRKIWLCPHICMLYIFFLLFLYVNQEIKLSVYGMISLTFFVLDAFNSQLSVVIWALRFL